MDFIITKCNTHGTTECADYDSFVYYVDVALWYSRTPARREEAKAHWICCDRVVIDPRGWLDYN